MSDANEPAVPRDEDVQDYAFLGREFLTWLLFRADIGEAVFGKGQDSFQIAFAAKVRIGALAGDVTDATLKGRGAAHGIEIKAGIGAGRTLREAELRLTRGDREWYLTLIADSLDLRGVKIPALLTEEDDDRFLERITLIEEADAMIQAAFADFIHDRLRPAWRRQVLPAIRTWLVDGLAAQT
jgi:hypothetical protein